MASTASPRLPTGKTSERLLLIGFDLQEFDRCPVVDNERHPDPGGRAIWCYQDLLPKKLLLQVVYHARMAEESSHFNFNDVVEAICDKMERRHPHVFGDATVGSAEEQSRAWEQHKSAEREHHQSALDGVALALPSLMRAEKLQRRAARVGFDWPDISGPLGKCHEEIAEIEQALQQQDQEEIAAEIGDLLFSVVNLARFAGTDPEEALRGSNLRFTRRFQQVERLVEEQGREMSGISLQELDAHGDQGMDKIVIDNVSIEIWPEDPNSAVPTEVPDMRAAGVNPLTATAADSTATRCFYYCYVIGGRRICQRICW